MEKGGRRKEKKGEEERGVKFGREERERTRVANQQMNQEQTRNSHYQISEHDGYIIVFDGSHGVAR